jgi:hypothetical protein
MEVVATAMLGGQKNARVRMMRVGENEEHEEESNVTNGTNNGKYGGVFGSTGKNRGSIAIDRAELLKHEASVKVSKNGVIPRIAKISNCSPDLGLHAVLKLCDDRNVVFAQGLVCIPERGTAWESGQGGFLDRDDDAERGSIVDQIKVSLDKIEIDMTCGGEYVGKCTAKLDAVRFFPM